jgi:tetratricopeptide (TPR) repeat protein
VTPALRPGTRETNDRTFCPDPEWLALYIDGRATPAQRVIIEAHTAQCEDCFFVLAETGRHQRSEREGNTGRTEEYPNGQGRWRLSIVGLAAAAAVVLAVMLPGRPDRAGNQRLEQAINGLESALGPYREFAPRLTADTTYRQMAPATRSIGAPVDLSARASSQEPVRTAAIELQNAARDAGDTEAARVALGVMNFRLGNAGGAVEALEPLAQSQNARVMSDLAAAYLARRAGDDDNRALELLERAVVLDPRCVEAWFNLGLAAESKGQRSRAIEAWQQALKLDGASRWTEEARWHLQKLTDR